MSQRPISLIGASSGWGAQIRSTEEGPKALKKYGLEPALNHAHVLAKWQQFINPKHHWGDIEVATPYEALPFILDHNKKIYKAVQKSLNDNFLPIVIGGDHSIAIGTWSSVTATLGMEDNFGLIWFDAHMDSHTSETSPSGAIHGMPLACLLGHGDDVFVKMGSAKRKLNPKHTVLIGIRSYEEGEQKLLEQLGVRVFYMEEIHEKGMEAVACEALRIVTKGTKGFGLSVDLDGFDPKIAPGVGSPEPEGLGLEECRPLFSHLSQHPLFKALEIMEYNPTLDKDNKTAQLVVDLMKTILT